MRSGVSVPDPGSGRHRLRWRVGPGPGHRAGAWWPVGALAGIAILVLGTSGAAGGFTASAKNIGDSTQTGSLLTSATVGITNECDLSSAAYSPITTSNTALCTSALLPTGTVPASGTAAVSTVIAVKGSLGATTARLTKGTCGAIALANSVTASNPMLVRGNTLAYAQPGPLTGSAGLGLSGGTSGTGYAAEVTSVAGTNSFTEAIWFKATTSGTLMGFANSPSAASVTSYDRMLWLDNTGHVVFGVQPTAGKVELTSPAATYRDGNWHFVAGTVSAAGIVLSIDGATVASSATTTTAAAYTGYWHVGWDNETASWTNPPTTPYFAGTLANAAIFPALTATQITNLRNASTQTAWNTLLTSSGATRAWTLGDAGTTAYTGTIPNVTPAACAFIDVTVGTTGVSATCAAPSSGTACAAPGSGLTLTSLAASTSLSPLPTPTQNVTIIATITRDATNKVATYPHAAGLHLTAPMTVVVANGTFTATLSWPSQDVVL
jgi:hypothetical protein